MASPDSPILSPERKEHFDELVDQGLWGQISAELADLPAADVAELLSHYGEDSLARLFECLPAEIKPDVLAELPADLAAGLAAAMPAADAADIVNEMAPDDAADVLGELDDKEVSSKIIEGMDDENADDVSRLMTYPEDSAGGIMTTDLVSLHPDQTVLPMLLVGMAGHRLAHVFPKADGADDPALQKNNKFKIGLIRRFPLVSVFLYELRCFLKCFIREKVHHGQALISRIFVDLFFIAYPDRPYRQPLCRNFHFYLCKS